MRLCGYLLTVRVPSPSMQRESMYTPFPKSYPICGARNRKGGVCRMRRHPGAFRCRWHGGMTPTKHGLRSHAWIAFRSRRCAELRAEWPKASVFVLPPKRAVPAKGRDSALPSGDSSDKSLFLKDGARTICSEGEVL